MIKKILFALLFTPSIAFAQPFKGVDLLGLGMMDAGMIAQELDSNSVIGVLDVTFKDPYPKIQQLIDSHKVIGFRVHLIDGTVNNHACSGDVTSLATLSARAKKAFNFFVTHNPSIQIYLSPVLEHGCNNPSVVNGWYAQLRKDAPGVGLVCSPDSHGYCPPDVHKELHGNTGSAPFRSNDGADVFSSTPDYQNSGSLMTFAWSYCNNGRLSSEKPGDSIPLPTQRRNFCSREEIRHEVRIMRTPQASPTMLCADIKPPDIGKPRAENYGVGQGDPRQNKPMVILTKNYSRMSIQTIAGKEVGCFKYFGSFGTNQSRLYEGNCSGKNPTELQDLLGGEWGKIVSGKDCYKYNPIRRLGVYR